MVEYKDGKKILVTPISAEDLKDVHIGDILYLSGSLTTCRDVAHRRVVEEGREIPVDVRNNAILHAGPIIRPLENDKFEMVSVGPTTSMRMEKFEYEFVKTTGVRVIVGKGGMKENTANACKDFGCIHCVIPAGNAVVAAVCVEEIERAEWRDLRLNSSASRSALSSKQRFTQHRRETEENCLPFGQSITGGENQ